jgi:hypothetical protein
VKREKLVEVDAAVVLVRKATRDSPKTLSDVIGVGLG